METILLITAIVMIAFGVLQIILFFKVWGMTNDVNKIKRNVSSTSSSDEGFSPAKFELLLGNEHKAKELLNREFLKDVIGLYQKTDTSFYDYERVYTDKYNKLEKRYRELYHNCPEFLDFGKLATYSQAKEKFS